MRRFFQGKVAALLVGSFTFSVLAFPSSEPVTAAPQYDFEACVESTRSASVLLMMDESGSVYGHNGEEPTDPDNLRITGAEVLFNSLQNAHEKFRRTAFRKLTEGNNRALIARKPLNACLMSARGRG